MGCVFATAVRIYAAINGEAAALETVATMGWDQFTVLMVQEALGLSYYESRGTTYSGLLEKCPAISYLDTMFTEDRGPDDGPGPGLKDTFSISAGFQQNFSRCRKDQSVRDNARSDSTSTERETRLSLSTLLQQNPHPPTLTGSMVSGGVGGCDPRNVERDPAISPREGENSDQPVLCSPLNVGTFRKLLKTAEKKGSVLQETLPGLLDHREFTRVGTDPDRDIVCDEWRRVEVETGGGGIATGSGFLRRVDPGRSRHRRNSELQCRPYRRAKMLAATDRLSDRIASEIPTDPFHLRRD